ncbi:MAG TPA: glutamate--cysteine ligase [Burkholderiaceae bacterium]|nr:glutamate--cysteine ligase [Burkholderiaceae bacterium]
MNSFLTSLRALTPDLLTSMLRGIEKEGLRATRDGMLALTPHPAGLGSALTHPHITTDFSESQLELITGVHTTAQACEDELTRIHQAVFSHLGDELMWGSSMPCRLPGNDDEIPLGRYGSSNVGRSKTIYRNGLAHRYGRRMQTISGIHYNFSLPQGAWSALQAAGGGQGSVEAYRNAAYFSLIRNFRRHSWLLLCLFGASPAVCRSFVSGRRHALSEFSADTLYLPHATSLRMGPLGYQSEAQSALPVSYNSLRGYAQSLNKALTEPYAPYEAIGVRDGDDYRQLATTLLQIENEFYGTIRPKRSIRSGERPLHALGERGVEYVEVRCMDIDPFQPVGITAATMRFLDVFLLHCLLSDSPPDSPEEIASLVINQHRAADRGRDPQTRLVRQGDECSVREWGDQLLGECAPIAEALDQAHGGSAHTDALTSAARMLATPSLAPSAQALTAMARSHQRSYLKFALHQSVEHNRSLKASGGDTATMARFETMARESIAEQAAIEAADTIPFEAYRLKYLEQDLMDGGQFGLPA